ncbi:MAG: thiamine diphosphokinase [Caldilinea sp.]|nr:thiamine diphosphokinase [Caldilineaceae bacterium]MCB9119288.1 thiamine diphosphokinase [Caldilineaceae bacterium]MCO5209433.1 thiamine diphosphokinase [Caldilinea sp.]
MTMQGDAMRAVIAVNGKIDDYAELAGLLRPDDHLIGADGGTLHLLAIDRRPNVVVGDLDSLPQETVTSLVAAGIAVERHKPEKDQTDLELALERALEDGADEIVLVGALGGRLDQTLANLLIVAQRAWPVPVRVVEGEQVAEVLRGPGSLALHGPAGGTVSAIPLSAAVTGITYTGLEYPLHDATLRFGSTRGVSNVLATSPASIRIDSGILLVIHSREASVR